MLAYWMFSFSFLFSFLFFRGLCFSFVDVFFESFFFKATSFQQPYENMKFFVIKSCDLFLSVLLLSSNSKWFTLKWLTKMKIPARNSLTLTL